jgi:methionyl-tRNA formyltransferase
MLRVAFAGTPQFAVPALRALAASEHQLVGVLTQPDRPAGRGREPKPSPIKRLALELGLPLAQPPRLASESERAPLRQWDSDLLVVVAYGLLLPRAALELPRHGCINIHASLLPRWRGAAPVQRSILAGDRETGVSIMQLDEGLDTGALLAQRALAIEPGTDAGTLLEQLSQLGAQLLLETLSALESGSLRPTPQPSQGITYAAKIGKLEARIDWSHSAAQIARQVRAFNPRPVAETLWRAEPLRIWSAQVVPDSAAGQSAFAAAVPGQVVLAAGELLYVKCGEGVLAVTRLQRSGRRVLSAGQFLSGQPLAGAQFT